MALKMYLKFLKHNKRKSFLFIYYMKQNLVFLVLYKKDPFLNSQV